MKKRIVMTLDLPPDLLDLEFLPPEVTLDRAAAAAEFGATDSMYAFLDGVRGSEETETEGTLTGIDSLSIGLERGAGTDPWDGLIAEAAVWDSVLTDAEHAIR